VLGAVLATTLPRGRRADGARKAVSP